MLSFIADALQMGTRSWATTAR